MRRYFDSRRFPFLTDLLFDELLNFDWESSRKEIEEAKKNKDEKGCNYLRVLDDNWSTPKVYHPDFELKDGVYTYTTWIPKGVKPEDIKIDASCGTFYFAYEYKSECGKISAASSQTLPEDLDVDSMKAVLKNGVLTITANQVVEKEEEKKAEDEDVEYEIEIGK